MRHRSSLTAVLAVVCITSPAAAQSAQRWSIQASGLYVGVFGDAYKGLKSGPGGELQVRVTPSLWSYGAGLQYSTHGVDNVNNYNISLSGVFFEPRRVFDINSTKVAPYASARLAYLSLTADLGPFQPRVASSAAPVSLSVARLENATLSASGFQGNVGGGVLIKLSPRVNLDLGTTVGLIRFGETQEKVGGRVVGTSGSTSGTGQNIVVRAGLAIGLGGGTKKTVAPLPKPPVRR